MSTTSAALQLLFPAAVAALMALALHLSAAAAAAAASPPAPPIGLPGCDTTCGNVSVPYPFGISPGCYWPGLDLNCDRSHKPPRLLLGDGTLRVTNISIKDTTVRVMHTGAIINTTGDAAIPSDGDSWNVPFGRSFTKYGYRLSSGNNELLVFGCNVAAILLADGVVVKSQGSIAGCASFCSKAYGSGGEEFFTDNNDVEGPLSGQCSGTSGCCQSNVTAGVLPSKVLAKRLYTGSDTAEDKLQWPLMVFVVEQGWIKQLDRSVSTIIDVKEAPFLLDWSVTHNLREGPRRDGDDPCHDNDVARKLCKSQHSNCFTAYGAPGYVCSCERGYDGNPYLNGTGGCQDIDECKLPNEEIQCFGECINTVGSYYCRCPHGTFGNPGFKGGCVKINSTASALLPTVSPPPLGLLKCTTTCGNMSVPYPFGISPGCYLPGFHLTCKTIYNNNPPRLFLDSNNTLEVVDISLPDASVRVIHHISTFNSSYIDYVDDFDFSVGFFDIPNVNDPYMLSTDRNEFIFSGCNVEATLYGDYTNGRIISSCNSTCSSGLVIGDHGAGSSIPTHTNGGYCSSHDGCCHAPILAGSMPREVKFKRLHLNRSWHNYAPSTVAFISEEGFTEPWHMILNSTDDSSDMLKYMSYPLVLRWAVKQDFPAPADNSRYCPEVVASRLCKSEHSECRQGNGGFTCHCSTGYDGNPYLNDGCQDIDECKITPKRCYGNCKNLAGKFKCSCKLGTFGDATKSDGCVRLSVILSKFARKSKIGLSAASGPVLLLLILGIMLVPRKIEQHKMKVLKQKYFKQNRGQLLQHLMSQKADIAERMIIPMDELAKATNNFDKARELGCGGHGTVYKGILSDLHVVAIKKSKITVQNEIDEFINEVAILSQVNHKNVVKLFGCCLETEVPLLVYEFISNGTLYNHLHIEGPRSLSWGNRLRIATEISTSLAYLHSAVSIPIIHRDIKSSNILLDDTLTAKVSDFGASRYIPIDKTGLTTRVQGTIGYLDPMYFQTNRLTEKSDVYSFGVILVELLTRKKPFSYLSTEGDGLVSHFLELHAEGNLAHIIDPQVIEEGGDEVQEVAALAASCINLRGEERPMMRQVEHTLEGLRGAKMYKNDGMVAVDIENDIIEINCPTSTKEGQRFEESSRRYSLEQEMMMSARYPR
ncbi:unnamed protein product [Urochloa decumbens]|uniref:Protein kinase domain-containing protein n=1 Tax=Urochloa decumbens TaxID=240449 RepID=A0ABC9B5R2_9POAL